MYKKKIKAMPNELMKQAIQQEYDLHNQLKMDERKDFSYARQTTIKNQDEILRIIFDGMGQNTTLVSRF
jgi:hypothetical protein